MAKVLEVSQGSYLCYTRNRGIGAGIESLRVLQRKYGKGWSLPSVAFCHSLLLCILLDEGKE